MTANGPDQPCQRTPCTTGGPADHTGGAHLDPRNRDLYDGPVTSYNAAPMAVRDALLPLMVLAGSFTGRFNTDGSNADSGLRAAVDIAVQTCLDEIDRLRQQVAAVRVDADRRVREASKRALDCDTHGAVITGLEQQLSASDRVLIRTEQARLALLDGHHALGDLLDAYAAAPDRLTLDAVITTAGNIHQRTAAAHRRRWQS